MSKKPQTKTQQLLEKRGDRFNAFTSDRQEFEIPTKHQAAWKTGHYKVGDGDHTAQIPRPGSCHKHLLSFGGKT